MQRLPVLDLAGLDGPDPAAVGVRLRELLHDVGFLQLVGHGVDAGLRDELLRQSRAFFALPEHEKLAIENVHSPQFRGYTRTGEELTNGQVDWREQLDLLAERDVVEPGPDVPDYWRLEGPNLWPAALPGLRDLLERWNAEMHRVSLRLVQALAVALGSPADVFDAAFADRPTLFTKIVRYPGVAGSGQGVGAHRDGGVLTLLLLEPGSTGLQVETADGGWIDVPPVEGAFVVNVGEMLELATGGYLRATVHRVLSPPAGSDRVSIPFFFNPAFDATLPRLDLPPELAARARGVSADPTDQPILSTYGDNVLRYRLRAHPNVAAIHHADLLGRG